MSDHLGLMEPLYINKPHPNKESQHDRTRRGIGGK